MAYAEFSRVLKNGGRALVYLSCLSTDRLEPLEADLVWRGLEVVPGSTYPHAHEAAMTDAGLIIDDSMEVGLEWGERAQERDGAGGRRLIHAARLLRDPQRYMEQFGQRAYEIMLSDCLWHVYRLLGKLSARVYLLSGP
jgi:hypothetical protein